MDVAGVAALVTSLGALVTAFVGWYRIHVRVRGTQREREDRIIAALHGRVERENAEMRAELRRAQIRCQQLELDRDDAIRALSSLQRDMGLFKEAAEQSGLFKILRPSSRRQ